MKIELPFSSFCYNIGFFLVVLYAFFFKRSNHLYLIFIALRAWQLTCLYHYIWSLFFRFSTGNLLGKIFASHQHFFIRAGWDLTYLQSLYICVRKKPDIIRAWTCMAPISPCTIWWRCPAGRPAWLLTINGNYCEIEIQLGSQYIVKYQCFPK